MGKFYASEEDMIKSAYTLGQTRIEDLERCNEKNESKIRQFAIDEISAHQEQISNLGFFDKTDFTSEEQNAIIEAANEIVFLDGRLEDAHEITLMELEADLAQAVQQLSLNNYLWFLRGHWNSERRSFSSKLPRDIPNEVKDEYNVLVFMHIQGKLNKVAKDLKDISQFKCLNRDDYWSDYFEAAIVLPVLYPSASISTDNYIELQKLKESERRARAAKEEESLSVGGFIWEVIGWDSPTDFLTDVVLTAAGGGFKWFRWKEKLKKAKDRLKRASKALDRMLDIDPRVKKMEKRFLDIQNAAKKLEKLKAVSKTAKKIIAAFEKIKQAQEEIKLLEKIKKEVKLNYVRAVASSIPSSAAANAVGAGPPSGGGVFANEAARMTIHAYLSGSILSERIDELKDRINFDALIRSEFPDKNTEVFLEYLVLLTTREFLVRMTLAFVHKLKLTLEMLVEQLIASFGAAMETILKDMRFMSRFKDEISGTAISSVRKTLVSLAQRLAKDLIPA